MTDGEGRRGPEISRSEIRAELRAVRFEIRHLKEIVEIQDKAVAKALEIQAFELSRRLAELNHEGKRIAEARAASVSADKFDEFRASYDTWRESVSKYIANQQGRLTVYAAIYGVALLVAAALISWGLSHVP